MSKKHLHSWRQKENQVLIPALPQSLYLINVVHFPWITTSTPKFASPLLFSTDCCFFPNFNMEDSDQNAAGRRKTIKVGPWGGNGGSSWDDGSYNGVREITLVYDRCIDSIRIEYDKRGKPVLADKHGGNGGNRTAHIKLLYPEEFLITVSGHYFPVVNGGTPVIRSLTLKSNRRIFGPFGVEEGTPFSFPMDGGLIVGFRGRSGWYLDAIGFRLSRAHTSNLFEMVHQKLQKLGKVASKSLGYNHGEAESNARIIKSKT